MGKKSHNLLKLIKNIKIFNKTAFYNRLLNSSTVEKNNIKKEILDQKEIMNRVLYGCDSYLTQSQKNTLIAHDQTLNEELDNLEKAALNYKSALDKKFNISAQANIPAWFKDRLRDTRKTWSAYDAWSTKYLNELQEKNRKELFSSPYAVPLKPGEAPVIRPIRLPNKL